MRPLLFVLGLSVVVGLTGCGGSQAPVASLHESPLTVDQWKAMPPETKYEVETFERLKLGNPKLQDQREWDKFARTVVFPAKKKDFPSGKPAK